MAIDTTNEKLALIEYGDVFQLGIPISSNGLGQDDKQQLLWGYPGILWEVIVVAVGLCTVTFISKKPGMAFVSKQPDVSFTSKKPKINYRG